MSAKILTKEEREVYNHSADWARSLFELPRWNIVALSMHVPEEAFMGELDRLSRRGTKYVGELATANGPIAFIEYSRPLIDTVRELVVVGGEFAPDDAGLGIVHALWANHMGVMSFEKRYGLRATCDDKYSLRTRSHFEIPIPEEPFGRIEIEEKSPKCLLEKSYWDTSADPVGLEVPREPYGRCRDRFMNLAKDVFWLDSAGDGSFPADLLGVNDFVNSQRTKADEVTAIKLFKSIARHLASGADDIHYAWLFDALYNKKFLYRGSLDRIYVSIQAVHDLTQQTVRTNLKIPGITQFGAQRLLAIFDGRLTEPSDSELFGQKPEYL